MKKLQSLILAIILLVSVSSCFTIEHTVGSGAAGSNTITKKNWYALWGLVDISNVDTKAMAGGAENYTIKTERSLVDGLIGIFTGIVTIYPTTVEVTK